MCFSILPIILSVSGFSFLFLFIVLFWCSGFEGFQGFWAFVNVNEPEKGGV